MTWMAQSSIACSCRRFRRRLKAIVHKDPNQTLLISFTKMSSRRMPTSWRLALLNSIAGIRPKLVVLLSISVLGIYALFGTSNSTTSGSSCSREAQLEKTMKLTEDEVPENPIFFFATANLTFLTPRQLCVIESAALHNQDRHVFVSLKTHGLKRSPGVEKLLEAYKNVQFTYLNFEKWLDGTVLEKGLDRDFLAASKYPVAHESDIVRLVALYKYGGTYLDLDALVLQNLGGLKNAIGFEDGKPDSIASGILAFNKMHPVMALSLKAILTEYNNHEWSSVGHVMLRKVLKSWCKSSSPLKPSTCKDVHLLSHEILYQPFPMLDWKIIYEDDAVISEEYLSKITPKLLSLHLYNSRAVGIPIRIGSNQVVAKLAGKHCPVVASTYQELWACDVHQLKNVG